MNLKSKDLIKKKISVLRKTKKKVFFKDIKIIEYNDFLKSLKSVEFVIDCIDQMSKGSIYILKNSINKNFLEVMKSKLKKISSSTKPINPKVKTGVKNGYYISRNLDSKGYNTVDKSFYFFSWNKDKTGIYKKILKIYKPLKILNGLNANEITNNKPRDEIIERLHIIHYPLNSGLISQHYDPIKVTIFNFGLYATVFGKDYDRGGFFVLNKKKNKIFIDKKVKKGDAVLFFPSLIHGVNKVRKLKKKKSDGRWFVNVNLAQSHEVKNREYTQKY